ncbi:MAG: HAD family hydrolase [Candidatus Omnitrophota bacterium]
MTPKKLLLFDIDGTLLYSGGAGRLAIEKTLEKTLGIQNAWGNTRPDGKTDRKIFEEIAMKRSRRKISEKLWGRMQALYIRHFRRHIPHSPFRLMPGVPGILRQLAKHKDKLVLGVQTGNLERTAWLKLERGRIRHFFKFGGFGSDSSKRTGLIRKAIDRGEVHVGMRIPRRSVFILGDAPQDIRAGKKLGARTIAVLTGKTPPEKILALRPDLVLRDLSEAKKLLAFLLDGASAPYSTPKV